MISRFFITTFTVKRMNAYASNKTTEASVGTISGHLQQLTAELTQQLGMTMTKSFRVWCAVGSNVQEGDSLEEGGNTYSVKAVQTNNYGANQHLELLVEKN